MSADSEAIIKLFGLALCMSRLIGFGINTDVDQTYSELLRRWVSVEAETPRPTIPRAATPRRDSVRVVWSANQTDPPRRLCALACMSSSGRKGARGDWISASK